MSLGNRIKQYENLYDQKIVPKMPAIIRIDGKAFHTYTKNLTKPWDFALIDAMNSTAKKLCSMIQCAQFSYIQSDEISILLIDWKKYSTNQWFDGRISKICSVGASIATAYFNIKMQKKKKELALFDSRVFSIPEHDVVNYFIWRQQDAVRNSIQSLAHAHFGHKQIQGLNTNELQEKLFKERNINWNNIDTKLKRGTCVVYESNKWSIDNNIPIFSQNRDYLQSRIPMIHENES